MLYAVSIVVYSVVVVLIRHSDSEIPNWVFWVLSFLLIGVLGWIRNIGKGYSKESEVNAPSPVKENGIKEQEILSASNQIDYVKELETVIYDYCEDAYQSKPSFPIKKSTNFKRNLNFDGIDMVEIAMAFEEKFNVKIPDNHPINQRLENDTDFTVEYFLSAYGLCDGVTDKKQGYAEEEGDNPETETINNTSSSKLARPKFTDEEAFAMGTLALSLADINQGTAMMVFMHEYEGYTAGDVKRIMADVTTDIHKALSIFMRMTDPFKKSYAAGFFASLIKASGAMDDTESIRVWRNCIETALHHRMSFADAVKWYEGCEHGKK